MEMELRIKLVGTRPLIMHNGRLANPLDPYAQAVAKIAKKRNKTTEDYAEQARIEARGGMYETEDGVLGLPTENVWKAIHEAAKAYKLGKDVERALRYAPDVLPITVDGGTHDCDDYLKSMGNGHKDRLYYVPVGVSQRKVMRARPRIATGWEWEGVFTLSTDILEVPKLEPVLERAGKYVGLCERRPTYGTFEASVLEAA